ncbi:hypothetical protein ACFLU3_04710 [Chloroflexota bacterium]
MMRNIHVIAVVLIILLLFLSVVVACDDDEETPETTVTPSLTPTAEPSLEPTVKPTTEPTVEPENGVTGDADEPAKNPFLADSPWSSPHRNSYCQGSSFYPGPAESPSMQTEDFLLGRPALIHPEFSSPYPDGGRVIWASAYGEVVKIDPEGDNLEYIDRIESYPVPWPDVFGEKLSEMSCQEASDFLVPLLPPDPELQEGQASEGTSGVFPVLGSDGILYQALEQKIVAYGDEIEGDRFSPIEIKRQYEIPQQVLPREWDKLVAMMMTYDGMLAFATNYGLVGIIDRNFDNAQYLQLGEGDEYVYNNIAADENGGIYVVTHKAMYRVQWTGEKLTIDEDEGGWRAEYGTGKPSTSKAMTAAGSGSTPSLMGTGEQDKFVVITDGEQIMNILIFWRDEIPDDWEQLPGTKSRRIAAQVPITFGDPDRERSFSDQSVLVRGYGAFVVNNELQNWFDTRMENASLSGEPDIAPYGCEKFEWNPETQTMQSVWFNEELSLPNAIPTMSSATNLIYQIGQRNGVWTLEAIDWDTGESAWHYEIGDRSYHNSFFAASVVGPDESIYYGTFIGLMRISP